MATFHRDTYFLSYTPEQFAIKYNPIRNVRFRTWGLNQLIDSFSKETEYKNDRWYGGLPKDMLFEKTRMYPDVIYYVNKSEDKVYITTRPILYGLGYKSFEDMIRNNIKSNDSKEINDYRSFLRKVEIKTLIVGTEIFENTKNLSVFDIFTYAEYKNNIIRGPIKVYFSFEDPNEKQYNGGYYALLYNPKATKEAYKIHHNIGNLKYIFSKRNVSLKNPNELNRFNGNVKSLPNVKEDNNEEVNERQSKFNEKLSEIKGMDERNNNFIKLLEKFNSLCSDTLKISNDKLSDDELVYNKIRNIIDELYDDVLKYMEEYINIKKILNTVEKIDSDNMFEKDKDVSDNLEEKRERLEDIENNINDATRNLVQTLTSLSNVNNIERIKRRFHYNIKRLNEINEVLSTNEDGNKTF